MSVKTLPGVFRLSRGFEVMKYVMTYVMTTVLTTVMTSLTTSIMASCRLDVCNDVMYRLYPRRCNKVKIDSDCGKLAIEVRAKWD